MPPISNPTEQPGTMNGKPVLYRDAVTALTTASHEFQHKLLCDGIVFNLGDACVYGCQFCYVESMMRHQAVPLLKSYNHEHGTNLGFQDVVIRRRNALERLKEQLVHPDGALVFPEEDDRRVAFSSTTVDPAANMELLKETAAACNLILDHTSWQIRLLSKSSLLHKLVADGMIPEKHHQRIIFGFSTGTLEDRVAKAIETGTALVSKRLQSLHWLQDNGFRTYAMICPSLPQEDYDRFSRNILDAVRADRCEHVWAEVINLRGDSLYATLDALRKAGLQDEAERLEAVSGPGSTERWENYACETFLAHARHCPPGKLRFLQYVTEDSLAWWSGQRAQGAVLIGKIAKKKHVVSEEPSAPVTTLSMEVLPVMDTDDQIYLESREKVVSTSLKLSVVAAKALYEIRTYRGGLLWNREFPSFEAYCASRWNYGKAHAYRLAACGEFLADLEAQSPTGDWMPGNESHVRPIFKLPRERRVECWMEAMSAIPAERRTARTIAKEVSRLAKTEAPRPVAHTPKKTTDDGVEKALQKLHKAASGHAHAPEIEAALGQIAAWFKEPHER